MVVSEPRYQTSRILNFDQSAKLSAYSFTVPNTQMLGEGLSMSADGSIFAASESNYQSNAGVVFIYKNVDSDGDGKFDSNFQLGQTIVGDNAGDRIGGKRQIALSGDGLRIVVGASTGKYVRVYDLVDACEWMQVGTDILGFGTTVDISDAGDIILVGNDEYDNGNGIGYGRARAYKLICGNWTQIGEDIYNLSANDNRTGLDLSLSGDGTTIAVGVPEEISGTTNGKVYILQLNSEDLVECADPPVLTSNVTCALYPSLTPSLSESPSLSLIPTDFPSDASTNLPSFQPSDKPTRVHSTSSSQSGQ